MVGLGVLMSHRHSFALAELMRVSQVKNRTPSLDAMLLVLKGITWEFSFLVKKPENLLTGKFAWKKKTVNFTLRIKGDDEFRTPQISPEF